jgi:hypothetical protein
LAIFPFAKGEFIFYLEVISMKYKYVGVVSLLLTLLTAPSLLAEPLETFWLDTYSPDDDGTAGPVSSDTVLKPCVPYLFQVDGSFSVWSPEAWQDITGEAEKPLYPSPDTVNGLAGMDISSSFALPTVAYNEYYPGKTLPVFSGGSRIQVSVDGGYTWIWPKTVERQYKANHAYTFRIVGQGYPLQVRLNDYPTSDNYGQFRLQLYPPQTSLGDGLVACYPFDGNPNDVSGYEHHATANIESPDFVSSPIGTAADFNGDNNGLSVTPTELLQPTRFITVSAWVKIHSIPPDWSHNKIVSNSRNPGPYGGYWLDIIPQAGAQYGLLHARFVANTNEHEGVKSATKLNLNQWHHLVGVYDGKKRYIFVDGKLDGMNTADSSIYYLPGNQFWIGQWHDGVFDGQIDQIQVYNRALSECEVKSLYTGQDECACQVFAVHDERVSDSQFLTFSPNTQQVQLLGSLKSKHDLEALAINSNGELYAASGNRSNAKAGYLYQVNKTTGELTEIGFTGFDEIDALAFTSDGILWGWAQGKGLLTINPKTAQSTVIYDYRGEIEDLTWNSAGTLLYGVENLHQQEDGGSKLWVYDTNANRLNTVCEELMGTLEVEALETFTHPLLPNDLLFLGIHGQTTLPLIDPNSCQPFPLGQDVETGYNDIEGIAITPSCRQ